MIVCVAGLRSSAQSLGRDPNTLPGHSTQKLVTPADPDHVANGMHLHKYGTCLVVARQPPDVGVGQEGMNMAVV